MSHMAHLRGPVRPTRMFSVRARLAEFNSFDPQFARSTRLHAVRPPTRGARVTPLVVHEREYSTPSVGDDIGKVARVEVLRARVETERKQHDRRTANGAVDVRLSGRHLLVPKLLRLRSADADSTPRYSF
jgi:hypothetical protein